MTAPTTPKERALLGSQILFYKCLYTEYAAAVGSPKLTFETGTDKPDITTYPSLKQVAQLSTDNYDSEWGGEAIVKQTHGLGPIKFPGKEMGKMTIRNLDVLDPEFLSYFPNLTVAEDSNGISIVPSRKVGDTTNILIAIWPQATLRYYEIMYKPSGSGKWKTSAAADGNSVQQLELVLDGEFVTDRPTGNQVGYINRDWPA